MTGLGKIVALSAIGLLAIGCTPRVNPLVQTSFFPPIALGDMERQLENSNQPVVLNGQSPYARR